MPELIVRIKKKTNGEAALSCLRADGSVTWQRQDGQLGRFFPLHDLTHYAVETVLGFDCGFFGLVASGWSISDFGGEGAKHRIPAEARLVEIVVGNFDLERMSRERASVAEFNERVQAQVEDQKLPLTSFHATDEQLDAVRHRRAELFALWHALPAGEALELPFQRRATTTTADTKSAIEA